MELFQKSIAPVLIMQQGVYYRGIAHSSMEERPVDDNTAFAVFVALVGAAMAGMAFMSVRLVGERTSANVMVI